MKNAPPFHWAVAFGAGSVLLIACLPFMSGKAQDQVPPRAVIKNAALEATISPPDRTNGYYRGTRFDWSGVVNSLIHDGHNYYGAWFTKTDPTVIDFVFRGSDIVAGPCSAISGPVEEFNSNGKALGFDDAKRGGTFIKIGVGVLRRPDEQDYNPYRLYDIVDPGQWSVHPQANSIEFTQELRDTASGYAYRYSKTLRLIEGNPQMEIEHVLHNTGSRAIRTDVYDHNFLVLDNAPIGPDFEITVPFNISIKQEDGTNPQFFQVLANRFIPNE